MLTGLHLGRDILIPRALALPLRVALVPVARALERIGIPRVVAALGVVLLAAIASVLFIALLVTEAVALASSLPSYAANLPAKVRALGEEAAVFGPLIVALAVDPGWSAPLKVIGLFIVVEAFCGHVLEVLLNAAATGRSRGCRWRSGRRCRCWCWPRVGNDLAAPARASGARHVIAPEAVGRAVQTLTER